MLPGLRGYLDLDDDNLRLDKLESFVKRCTTVAARPTPTTRLLTVKG